MLCEPERFVEAIVAPSYEPAAVEILTSKPKWKASVRLMEVGPLKEQRSGWQHRPIAGGMLVQDSDETDDPESEWKTVTTARPTIEQMADLRLSWALVRHVKSNAITVVKGGTLVGAGPAK